GVEGKVDGFQAGFGQQRGGGGEGQPRCRAEEDGKIILDVALVVSDHQALGAGGILDAHGDGVGGGSGLILQENFAGGLENDLGGYGAATTLEADALKLDGAGPGDGVSKGVDATAGSQVQIAPEEGDGVGRGRHDGESRVRGGIAGEQAEGDEAVGRN